MFYKILILPLLLFTIYSCSSDKNQEEKVSNNILITKVSNFVSNKENIMAFGHINMFQILSKSDYKKHALINLMIDPFISKTAALNEKTPVYFAVELSDQNISPLNLDDLLNIGNFKPKGFAYSFFAIKDKKEIKKQLEQEVKFKTDDGIDYVQEKNITFALLDDCIMMMADLDDQNKVEISQLKSAVKFMETGRTSASAIVSKAMSSKSDLMLSYDMGKSVSAVIKGFNIPTNDIKQLEKDLKGCFNTTNLNFEDGKIVLTSENILSPAMSKWRITNQNSKEIVSSLGSGSPAAAIALNIDVDEIQKIFDAYLASSLSEIESKLSPKDLIEFNRIKNEGLSSLFNGKFGISVFLKNDKFDGIPNINFQLGAGAMLLEKIKEPLEILNSIGFKIETKNNIIYGYNDATNAPGNGSLKLPEGAQDFGDFPMNGFIDFQNLPLDKFVQTEEWMKIIDKLSLLKFKVEGDKFTLEIQFKNKSENSLAQIINSFITMDFLSPKKNESI